LRAKAALRSGSDIARPLGGGDVRVIDDEALLNPQARLRQGALPLLRAQQIEADAHVGCKKALLVERRLARRLDADEY
jgi:hypothetical protein